MKSARLPSMRWFSSIGDLFVPHPISGTYPRNYFFRRGGSCEESLSTRGRGNLWTLQHL
jgi:hypothetical protein